MAGMSHATGVPAGWYPNAQGELQWWDGAAWGQLAPQPPAPQVTASASCVKSRTSPSVWWSFAASALGIVLALIWAGSGVFSQLTGGPVIG